MRTLVATAIILAAAVALPAADPPPTLAPTPITYEKGTVLGEAADALAKQSGIPVTVVPAAMQKAKCGVRFKDTPFWEALQTSADTSQARITLTDGGRKVELVPKGASQEVAATSGAFRVVAQQVTGRALLDQGVTFHDVSLLVHWEPRLRVYRIDTAPRISSVSDAVGSKISAEGRSAQVLPANATSEMRVRLTGLTRQSERITALAGAFTVTAAEKLLSFAFAAPGGKLPAAQNARRRNRFAQARREEGRFVGGGGGGDTIRRGNRCSRAFRASGGCATTGCCCVGPRRQGGGNRRLRDTDARPRGAAGGDPPLSRRTPKRRLRRPDRGRGGRWCTRRRRR